MFGVMLPRQGQGFLVVMSNEAQVFLVLLVQLVVDGLDVALGEGFDGVSRPRPEQRHDEEDHDPGADVAYPRIPHPRVGGVVAKDIQVVNHQVPAHLQILHQKDDDDYHYQQSNE